MSKRTQPATLYFTSCYLLCFWPIPLLQPDPIYRSRKLCVYSMLIAPRTDQSSKSPQPPSFTNICPEKQNRVRSASADKGKPGQTPVAQGGVARPCTSTCTDSLAWVCFWRWAWRFVKISYCWVMSILSSRSWNPKSRNSPMYHSVRICRLECGGSTQGSGLRHPPNVRVFSSRPEKDVRPKEQNWQW